MVLKENILIINEDTDNFQKDANRENFTEWAHHKNGDNRGSQ